MNKQQQVIMCELVELVSITESIKDIEHQFSKGIKSLFTESDKVKMYQKMNQDIKSKLSELSKVL